jgi:branched-chain amino acid transport system ATP-binding protein
VTPSIACADLHAYYGAFHALKGVSVGFRTDERVALFGHNGSGKSTLLKCCIGALPDVAGSVSFADTEIAPGDIARNVRLGIGYIPQTGNVFKDLSVERNLRIAGLRVGNDDLGTTWAMLPLLRQRRGQLAGTMSGGEQQLLAFAMALMSRPRILLLDEPTAGLSPVMAQTLLGTVIAVSRESGIGFIIVEHNLRRTLRYVDRAVILKGGRVAADLTAEALGESANLWSWF